MCVWPRGISEIKEGEGGEERIVCRSAETRGQRGPPHTDNTVGVIKRTDIVVGVADQVDVQLGVVAVCTREGKGGCV